MKFSFCNTPRIVFGAGESERVPELVAPFGRRVFFVHGAGSLERSGVLPKILDQLSRLGVVVRSWTVAAEPDLDLVDAASLECRSANCDVVLAIGGGSVLDSGKAIAALATNPGKVLDYIEEVGEGREFQLPPLPLVAVPTTAGSGAEVTRNSVLRVPAVAAKRSMRGDCLIPRLAIIDPTLSSAAPPAIVAAAGMDALTHLIEAYVSRGAQPMTDALALPGIRLIIPALRDLARGAPQPSSGQDLALASLWGGLALANAGLGAVHGLAAPIGGRCSVAHGVLCACLLPSAIQVNVTALRRRGGDGPALARFQKVAELVAGTGSTPEQAAETLEGLRAQLGIPPLQASGLASQEQSSIVATSRGGSMKNNPITLTDEEIEQILKAALMVQAL